MALTKDDVISPNLTTALGGMPAAGADVMISEGAQVYNAGLDISTNEINSLVVTRRFRGSLGVAGSVVTVDLTGVGDYAHYSGQGMAWLTAKTAITKAVVYETGTGGIFHASGGTYDDLQVRAGHVEVQAAAVVTAAYVSAARQFNAAASATAFTTLVCENASGKLERGATTSEFRKSDIWFDNIAYSLGTCTIADGARVKYNGTTLTKLIGKPGGILDLTYHSGAADAGTIGLTITAADLWPGFRIINPSSIPITWTAEPVPIAGGPEWFVNFTG